jgi:hypothetical protein
MRNNVHPNQISLFDLLQNRGSIRERERERERVGGCAIRTMISFLWKTY